MKPRVVLATLGSLGDLHPFLALGQALQAHGVDVVMACAAEYRDKVETAGLNFQAIRPSFADMERELGMNRAQLTDAVVKRSDFLFRRLILPHLREAYDDMMSVTADAALVLTSSLVFTARLAAERRGIPWIGIVLQPLMFFSAYDPPVFPAAPWLSTCLRRLGPTPTACVLGAIKFAVGRMLAPVRRLRRDIGLRPSALNPLFEGQFSEQGAIGLYSPLLGPVRADYPQPAAIVGFANFDSHNGAPSLIDSQLLKFLDAGPKPLVFTLGSLIVHSPGTFYRESVATALRLGKRAVLLVGERAAAEVESLRSRSVHICSYAPHSLLFPRAEAIIHQGGIGTLAQGLRSGRPQLIVPFFADQLDNAARAAALGAARVLAPRRYTADSARRALHLLLTDPTYLRHAARIAADLSAENGAEQAALLVLNRLESRTAINGDIV